MPLPKISAGLLMFRRREGRLEVFLAHPGGPYFKNKDDGHWTIPKGELDAGEDPLEAARREFKEELGLAPPAETVYLPLGSVQQKGGKIVQAWAFEGDWPEGRALACNRCPVQWPPRSGRWIEIAEVDRAQFFRLAEAKNKIKDRQRPLLERLEAQVGSG